MLDFYISFCICSRKVVILCNYLAPSPKGEFLCKFGFKLAYQNTKIGENWR